ncbi:MAG TPA: AAA family ATPase [Luteitalea sp.]|nr:AAA family ATPase [Luteitalea sp.]
MNRFVVISGCSGGGKSTLLTELARRGHAIVEEPGRRIVREALASGSGALPWVDLEAFGRRALEMARADHASARAHGGWVFFDRGAIDAAVALQHAAGTPLLTSLGTLRYHPRVFVTPPWPEIHATDAERRHDLADAVAEYERLLAAYPSLGYDIVELPRTSVEARADLVEDRLSSDF